jgi:plastocyanin
MPMSSRPGPLLPGRPAMLCVMLGCLLLPAAARSDGGSQVTIDNFTFSPPALKVSRGTEVTWKNQDDIPHSIVLGAIGVHSKALDTDKTFSYRFDKAGTFSYVCGLHPHMHAQVVVK